MLTIILGIALFFISGKKPDLNQTPCHKEKPSEATITILLPNGPINFRNPGYEYYIPQLDLRDSSATHIPAKWKSETTNFCCIVTVTSPRCSSWTWEGALTPENRNYQNMKIKRPNPAYTATVTVEYYEVAEVQGGLNFNKSIPGDFFNALSRIVYQGTTTLIGGRKAAEPIRMKPIRNLHLPLNMDFSEFQYSKGINIENFPGINQLIENIKY